MKGIAVIAKQRTGTNFLRSLLAQSTDGRDCGEVFHTETRGAPANFWGWMERTGNGFPAIRDEDAVRAILRPWLTEIENRFAPPVLDLKYNSLWAVAPTWMTPLDLPVILKMLDLRGWRFVHLTRQNRLDHAMSHILAGKTGVFVTREAVEITERFRVDPKRVALMMKQYEREQAFVGRLLTRLKSRTETTYEALNGAEPAAQETILRDIVAGTDITFRSLAPARTRKILKDWRENVENLAEIEAEIAAG
jgi:LPS sulfotransferase NodH